MLDVTVQNGVVVNAEYRYDRRENHEMINTITSDTNLWELQPGLYKVGLNVKIRFDSSLIPIPTPTQQGCTEPPLLTVLHTTNNNGAKTVTAMYVRSYEHIIMLHSVYTNNVATGTWSNLISSEDVTSTAYSGAENKVYNTTYINNNMPAIQIGSTFSGTPKEGDLLITI